MVLLSFLQKNLNCGFQYLVSVANWAKSIKSYLVNIGISHRFGLLPKTSLKLLKTPSEKPFLSAPPRNIGARNASEIKPKYTVTTCFPHLYALRRIKDTVVPGQCKCKCNKWTVKQNNENLSCVYNQLQQITMFIIILL